MTSLFKPIKLILEFYYMSLLKYSIKFCEIFTDVRYDLKIPCDKFQENLLIIDGEIDEKHALQNYQNECDPGYRLVKPRPTHCTNTTHSD